MSTEALVKALEECVSALSEEHDGADFEAECPECQAHRSATLALAAYRAAQPAADGAPTLPDIDGFLPADKRWTTANFIASTQAYGLAAFEQGRQQGRAQAAEWVPVSERLPEVGQPVLIATRAWGDPDKERIYGVAVLNEAGEWDNPQDPEYSGTWWPATHWMQLGPPTELGTTKGDAK